MGEIVGGVSPEGRAGASPNHLIVDITDSTITIHLDFVITVGKVHTPKAVLGNTRTSITCCSGIPKRMEIQLLIDLDITLFANHTGWFNTVDLIVKDREAGPVL